MHKYASSDMQRTCLPVDPDVCMTTNGLSGRSESFAVQSYDGP